MHQPDFVSSVSRMNLRIRFMASSSLAPERSTPCSMSSSILERYIRLLWRQTVDRRHELVVFDNFATHQASLLGQCTQRPSNRIDGAVLFPDHHLGIWLAECKRNERGDIPAVLF